MTHRSHEPTPPITGLAELTSGSTLRAPQPKPAQTQQKVGTRVPRTSAICRAIYYDLKGAQQKLRVLAADELILQSAVKKI